MGLLFTTIFYYLQLLFFTIYNYLLFTTIYNYYLQLFTTTIVNYFGLRLCIWQGDVAKIPNSPGATRNVNTGTE